jgi:hypothetical protein
MWQALFSLTNAIALAGWVLLIAFPRRPLTATAILYLGVGLLCLCYVAILALLLSGVAGSTAALGNYSVSGIRALFANDGVVVLGWTHYLAFDLFVGLWISKDADAKGFSRLAQVPVLVATCLVGPVGLLVWMMVRERRARAAAPRTRS